MKQSGSKLKACSVFIIYGQCQIAMKIVQYSGLQHEGDNAQMLGQVIDRVIKLSPKKGGLTYMYWLVS